MSWLAASPVLVPMATLVAAALVQKRPAAQTWVSYVGLIIFLACALALTAEAHQGTAVRSVFGDWGAPYGIDRCRRAHPSRQIPNAPPCPDAPLR